MGINSGLLNYPAKTLQLSKDSLARAANDAIVSEGGKSYKVGSVSNILYRASGGSDDWMKSVGGIALCYTIELPGGGQKGFDLPAAEILPTVSQFFPCMRVFEEHVRNISTT
uniref:Peptidase M14 domain-containing protein n=1 Tax=Timema poppense TaxID=170557 RepID=A0A7R9DMS3_TIMPO|nr:unnamed protein product [Timema poppensis]